MPQGASSCKRSSIKDEFGFFDSIKVELRTFKKTLVRNVDGGALVSSFETLRLVFFIALI